MRHPAVPPIERRARNPWAGKHRVLMPLLKEISCVLEEYHVSCAAMCRVMQGGFSDSVSEKMPRGGSDFVKHNPALRIPALPDVDLPLTVRPQLLQMHP